MEKPLTDAIKAYLAKSPVCRIASVTASGQPHVIPVCPVFDGETVYVDLGTTSVSGRAVINEPRVAVLFDEYFDDWSKLRKVLLKCQAEPVTGAEQEAAWAMIRQKFPQYEGIDWKPRLTVALRIQTWLSEGL